MPVVKHGNLNANTEPCNKTVRKGNRRNHFDACVQKLVPNIQPLRGAGVKDIRAFAERLNAMGILAPSGRRFSYGTMHRVLKRAKVLGLDEGARTLSEAASQKPYRFTSNCLKAAKQKEAAIKIQAALSA